MTRTARAVSRSPGFGRGVSALAVGTLTVGIWGVLVAPAPGSPSAVPTSQPLVVLLHDHIARTRPSLRAQRIEAVDSLRPLTRVRTVLPVLRHARRNWVKVRLPGRPNGHTGWIRTWQTRRASTEWHIRVKVSARRVVVYRDGGVERRFRAVVGTPSTPTPRGRFFVEEALSISSQDHGGPFALATSARSEVLQEFGGGPGQIGLHGTNNLSGALGTAVSHGCVRLDTGAITWMARRIGSGVPVTVTR
jgi:lipoprotein-anchoring transpeptidase ErfK/SrfK